MIAEITPSVFYWVAILALILWLGLLITVVAAIMKPPFWSKLKAAVSKCANKISLFFALSATLGSLWLSQLAGYTPCLLCWWQRIFMYPLVIVFLLALCKKQKMRLLSLWMSGIGALIALYHYGVQRLAFFQNVVPCEATASCSSMYLGYWGFFSIPLMAATAFVCIFVVQLWFVKK